MTTNFVKDMDDYKKNLSVLEKRLSEDCNDLATDLQGANSWLDNALGPDMTEEKKKYFFQDSFPKILKSALTRKYDPTHNNFTNVLIFLERSVKTTAELMSEYPEGMSVALREVMESSQPFYKKYCAMKENALLNLLHPQQPQSQNGAVADPKFISEIAQGDVVDFFKNNRWMIGAVDAVSQFKTEIEVSTEEGNEWVSLENSTRLAPYGSKTDATAAPQATQGTVAAPPLQVAELGDGAWRHELSVGDLVDAQDKSGMWFQACVFGVKRAESCAPSQSSAKYPQAVAVAVSSAGSLGVDPDLDAMYESSSPGRASVEMVVEEDSSASSDLHGSDSMMSLAIGEAVDEEAVDPAATAVRTLVHIVFVGHPERSDEWICLEEAGTRIQPLNSLSFGRRGENPVREEVQFLANLKSASQQAEIDSFALYREGCFVEPQLVSLVNVFGQSGGFDAVLRLMHEDSTTSVQAVFAMITAVGHMHRVLSKSFLASFGPRFLDAASVLLSNMNLAAIRETPVEVLEAVFAALEHIAVAHFGRNAATGRILEPLKLKVALRNLSGPYLNRRLGGLKILSELVRRAEAKIDCPQGLRTTVTTSNGVENTSFRVVPVTYHLTLGAICAQLVSDPAMAGIFEGGNAHESLMARASGVLCAIASQNALTEGLITSIWTAGFVDRKAEALRVLSEVIPLLDPLCMAPIMGSVAQMQASVVTVSLVDITAAIAVRCRVFLFANETQFFAEAQSDAGQHLVAVYRTYSDIVRLLWCWAEDGTSALEAVVTRSLEKIEVVLDHGSSALAAAKDDKFPWAVHWKRMQELLETALSCIAAGTSVAQAIKVVQFAINAWPAKLPPDSPVVLHLPFQRPTKQHLVNFLSAQYSVLDVLVGSVVRLKASLGRDVQAKALIAEDWGAALNELQESGGRVVLALPIQAAINELRVDGSRVKYIEQLRKTLQFVHTFMRFSEELELSQRAVADVWHSVVGHPLTNDEVKEVAGFLRGVVLKLAVSVGDLSDLLSEKIPSAPLSRRNTVTSKETARWIFDNIVNNTSSDEGIALLRSPYFNREMFECFEWWFRWANVEAGGLVELQPDPKSSASTYMITGAPHALRGLELFPAVILNCESDLVAGLATKFFTSLPQFLSPELKKNSDSLVEFRSMFVKHCVQELEEIYRSVADSSVISSSARLSRVLLFLDGILEESSVNSEHRIVPHGTVGKGNSVVFKVNSTSKSLKHLSGGLVTMSLFDSVRDLVLAVAKQLDTTPSDIKIFRRGKELGVGSDNFRTIAALQGSSDISQEALVVSERPTRHQSKSPCTSPGASRSKQVVDLTAEVDTPPPPPPLQEVSVEVSTAEQMAVVGSEDAKSDVVSAPKIPLTAMPSWQLANDSENFELLFNLMQASSGADCDRIWKLVMRLPTSGSHMTQWLELDCRDVSELLMNFDKLSINSLSELLYKLQVVDVLLQPAASQEALNKQQGGVGDVDHSLLLSWAERFVERGGFQALCQAHDWLEFALEAFLNSVGPVMGATVGLLQTATSLVSKMLRGFLIRISACTDQKRVLPVLRSIKKKSDAANKPIVGPALPPPAAAVTTSVSTSSGGVTPVPTPEIATPVLEEDSTVLALAVLEAEWGWRITTDVSHWSALHKAVEEVDLAHLQRTTLSTMTMLRRLSHHEHFASTKATNDGALRTVLAARHDAVLSMLGDLLVAWGCMAALTGDILLHIRRVEDASNPEKSSVNCKALLSDLLLGGYEVRVDGEQYVQESKLAVAIGDWFAASLLTVMEWSASFSFSQSATEDAGNPSDSLCSQVFLSLLDLRPSLVDAVSNAAESSSAVKMSNKKVEPLFTLASAVLDSLTPATLAVIPAETRQRTCSVILEELRELSRLQKADPQCVFPHLEGTVKLLAALPAGDEQILSSVFNRKTQEFLLTSCLGVVPLEQSREPVLCIEDNSRKYIYTLIYEACAKNSTILRKLAATLQASHASVPRLTAWDYRPERDSRSTTGFVGLKNLGSTCYMNSLMQVLYMNRHIRDYVLSSALSLDQADEILKDDLALQLRKLFYSLQHSERKSFVPTDWTQAFKDETGCCPINVMQQQDAQEFLQLLCERFEQSVAAHNMASRGSGSPLVDIMHSTFGGKLCNQMFKTATGQQTQEETAVSPGDIREQEESFVCISLEVKGSRGLECSLERFVEGEQIADYQWEDGSTQRHTITKRQVISQLGDTLVFHLKRFELNFDTFRREKVNDRFPFPALLDMRPYSKEGLSGGAAQQQGAEYFEYELGGVVVHTGTTDSGHYFAYIKDSARNATDSAKWFEFNDSEVSPFAEGRIEAECFGGSTSSGDYNISTQTMNFSETVNPKSAYMLVYNRVVRQSPVSGPSPAPTVASSDLDLSTLDKSDEVISNALKVLGSSSEVLLRDSSLEAVVMVVDRDPDSADDPLSAMRQLVDLENAQHALSLRVLNVNHMTFYKNVVEGLFRSAALTNRPFYGDLLEQLFHFATRYLARTSCVALFSEVSALLTKYLDSYTKTGFETTSPVSGLSPRLSEASESCEAPSSPERSSRPSNVSSPLPSTGPAVPPNQLILGEVLRDVDGVMSNLYAPREELRKDFAALYLKVFKMTAEQEGSQAFLKAEDFGIDMRFGLITNAFAASTNVPASVPSSAHKIHSIPEAGDSDEDAELAMAIAMSTGSDDIFVPPTSTPVKAAVRTVTLEAAPWVPNYIALAPRFLWELTLDGRMQQISEHWRKSSSHVWLLLEISKLHSYCRDFLVRRRVVTHLVDTVLGDQSPLCGVVYSKGSRKRAPSSYVAVSVTKDGTLPLAARNIPDWTLLVELLTHLVKGCYNPSDVPPLMQQKNSSTSVLDDNDTQCITVKTLFSTLLRQPRYTKHTTALVAHLSYRNRQFVDLICEAVMEELGLCSIENTAHLFDLLSVLTHKIPDGNGASRASTLFGQGPLSLLETMKVMKDNAAKARFLCVLIKSFLSLAMIDGGATVLDQVARPHSRLTPWAPWVLKFLFRFQTKCANESRESSELLNSQTQINQAILASHAPGGAVSAAPVDSTAPTAVIPSAQKGGYLLVFGETEEERESTWATRSERAFQMLQRLLESVNANIDALMPEDAFDDPGAMEVDASCVDPDLGAAMAPLGPHTTYDDKGNVVSEMAAAGGAMTDEEFALYMESGKMDLN